LEKCSGSSGNLCAIEVGGDLVERRTNDAGEESSGAQHFRDALEPVQIRTFIEPDGFAPNVNLVL
jgi:hypothetical protein